MRFTQKEIDVCLGIPGQIVEISDEERKLGMVDVSGVKREVNLACIISDDHPTNACVGDPIWR